MPLGATDLQAQTDLKTALQAEKSAQKLETLSAALVGRLLGLSIPVARSGSQHGGDAGPGGQQDRRFRLEAKKYADSTPLSDRELLGEIDHALARDEALEAWILVATRNVPEQLVQDLFKKGERIGVPIVIVGWSDFDLAPMAALCASGPDLVESMFSKEAADAARALEPVAGDAIESLRRDLQVWSLGFETLRAQSHAKLADIWTSRRTSHAQLGQDAAGGAQPKRITRTTVRDALDEWWRGPARTDAPAAIIGYDGVGKTWAALDWLTERQPDQPIVLTIPSSAVAPGSEFSETAVKLFLAARLHDLTGVRDVEHWLRRLDRLFKRPPAEGPALTILIDGLNQEPSIQWLSMLRVLQSATFEGRLRVMVSTRRHHFEERLSGLRGLAVAAVPVPVEVYDVAPGGELDRMLGFEGIMRSELHPDLVEIARTPRLFKLVVRFRDRLVEGGQVTVHRLLWEYGRDSFGDRAARSFSEAEWRAWLAEVAHRHREGVQTYTLRSLGETASRPDLSEGEVYARLSDIIDGRFAAPVPSGAMQLSSTVVAHALGAALLWALDGADRRDFAQIEADLSEWLDPISGLDQRAEILRAAVSILIERGGPTNGPVAGVLVTAWLQSQNVTDAHRRELAMLASNIPDALLDAVEHSDEHSQASARLWAVNALRAIPRVKGAPLTAIVARLAQWLSRVSRDIDNSGDANEERERHRADRYTSRIGVDASGPLKVLGVEMSLVDRDDGRLQALVPSIVEDFPLAQLVPCFERVAISFAIVGQAEAWRGLKWLCYLNEVDPDAAALALRALSTEITQRAPEPGLHPKLPARVGVLLLCLTGHEADEEMAAAIDDRLDDRYVYERHYLDNPARSMFTLERRHADIALCDTGISMHYRLQRTHELWLDPTFEPPQEFVQELLTAAAAFDAEKLDRQPGPAQEDWQFEQLEPALARCSPQLLAELVRRKLRSFASRPPESRLSSAVRITEHFILAGSTEASAARALRLSARENNEGNEFFAGSGLATIELLDMCDAPAQFQMLIEADLKSIPADFVEVMAPPAIDEIDALIARYRDGTEKQRRDLIVLLSVHPRTFGDDAWHWLAGMIANADDGLRGVLFRMLALADGARFGRMLAVDGWTWDPAAPLWVNHYGTGALIKAETGLPFDQLAPRLAPWRLFEAARARGGDPAEIRLAAEIFGLVLSAPKIAEPDPGSDLSVDRTETRFVPFVVSVQPRKDPRELADPAASLRAALDMDARVKAHTRAIETATKRIDAARKAGASLYLTDVDAIDMQVGVVHALDQVDHWLEGYRELTTDFRRRVRLAEPAFLALCEALLAHDPAKGVELWRSLRDSVATRYLGACGVDDLLHIAFQCPESAPVAALRDEIVTLRFCHRDRHLFDVATAAWYNGKHDWLSATASADQASPLVWRQRRGILLAGLSTDNALPVPEAWPDGPLATDRADLRRKAARLRWSEACAHHWWRTYIASATPEEAYAAWILFLQSADIRAWSWMRQDACRESEGDDLLSLKLAHVRLNRFELKRAMEKRMEKPERKFLDEDIVEGIGPWGTRHDDD
ncbi:hypothetical protein [Bradyrhizobium sp. 30]|uniref:hypothetical protein n=1 Tax=Bradyrhizobium sp. 30 TaxID=2782669 RepID=UPI001FFA59FC|nr:hypothetical protein [Bradyrhizobium sp. 30]MCK1295338.1 hypothetical protein [Bradyrhizobium sp. 30]